MRQVHPSRGNRIPEPIALPSLDLHERDQTFLLDYEIDIPMPGPEPALNHSPALFPKPPFGYPLSKCAECLPGR